ncbi:hypothetical protein CLAVI_000186 [Candidatus Clavichlamydia salmonicola]|uniref:hypothetical protein n=1 Tax=Candidatus Clavichlamydia salmonicola TaxID=469812 RepID=UPI00189161C6|nr:hypothetical protein [Candidatus Clavichlamydia salmonicola]MBF5050575.1 hypothetical protein [Candidatus Clavichlamydia salmonicola]
MSSSIDPSSSGSQSSNQFAWQNLLSTVKKNVLQTNAPIDPASANAKAPTSSGPDAAMMDGGKLPDGFIQPKGTSTTGPVKETVFVDSFGRPKALPNGPTMEMSVLMQDKIEKASQIQTKDVKEITNLQFIDPDTTVGSTAFLPPPKATVQGEMIKKDMGFLALLGLVLTLLAKANSGSFSEQFKAQNSDIQAQLALAPQIGDAIRAQAAAQSDATLLQAQQQLVSGVMNICAFAAAGAMGMVGVITESSAKLGSAIFTKETAAASAAGVGAGKGVVGEGGKIMDDVAGATGGAGGATAASKATQAQLAKEAVLKRASMQEASAMKASKASETAESNVAETVANATTKSKASKGSAAQQAQANSKMTAQKKAEQQVDVVKNQSSQKAESIDEALNNPQWKEKMSRGFSAIKSSAGKGVEKMGIFLDNASKVAMLSNLLVQGVDGIAGSIYQTQIAAAQVREGEAQATSTTLQQISGVYGQLAGQAQSLGEQSMQNMNQALQLLQNAADSSTSTTAAIFH